jgi:hypothetical protein
MAEGTGITPNYALSRSTLSAVRKARVAANKAAILGATGEIVGEVGEKIQAKKVEKEEALGTWDEGFAAMGDRGSWASGELYDQFQAMEEGYKEEYLDAVKRGDKQAQARLLKDQGARSNNLKGWKETMETAKRINDGVGWSNTFKGDPESLHIMEALTKLDGTNANVRVGDKGELVFDVVMPDGSTRSLTRREVDDMVSKGIKPVEQELAFMNGLLAYEEAGASGKPFNADIVKRKNELNIKDEEIPALMREDFGGGGTFAQHIKDHPDMIATFADVMGDGDGIVSEEEKAAFDTLVESDMDAVIDEMEKNPKIAKKYIAEWKMLQEKAAYEKGRGVYDENKYRKDLSRFKKGSLEQKVFIWEHDTAKATAGMSPTEIIEYINNNPAPTE